MPCRLVYQPASDRGSTAPPWLDSSSAASGTATSAPGARLRAAPTPIDRDRLGWLDVAETMAPQLDRLEALGAAGQDGADRAVYLLGMGGSSLCAEVLRSVLGVADGLPELHRPRHDRRADDHVGGRPARTRAHAGSWSSSKSGGTVEVASMERFFWANCMAAARGPRRPSFHRHHRPGHRARGAGPVARVPRGLRQPAGHRRPLLRAVALRPGARGAHRRVRRPICSPPARHGRRLPAGERARTPGSSSARSSAPRPRTAATS